MRDTTFAVGKTTLERKTTLGKQRRGMKMNEKQVVDEVQAKYAEVARGALSNETSSVRAIASAFGYSVEELNQLPAEANMGLSCGNPVALASLREGEVVVDLGCGGGMDVFLAAHRVGPTGRVIGIDMTTEMLERARAGKAKLGLAQVEFHQATIDQLPLADQSVDCVISNCVINLVPDKLAVFREIWRVLKPGGRVALSDIALKQDLPAEVKQSLEAYVGCISGAILIEEYRGFLEEAGFASVVVTDTGADLNAYAIASESGCCGGGVCEAGSEMEKETQTLHEGLASLMKSFDANAYAASVRVLGWKGSRGLVGDGEEKIEMTVGRMRDATFAERKATLEKASLMKERAMKTVQVYDKAMCCSTGVCGPEVDPVLPRFAADLDWLKSQGHQVDRYNLAQQPQAFVENAKIRALLGSEGPECLPVVVVEGEIVSRGQYPTRDEFSAWVGGGKAPVVFPMVVSLGGCCGGPASSSDACCESEEKEKKPAGGSGCGCDDTGCC